MKKVIHVLDDKFEEIILVSIFVFVIILVSLQVLFRYVIHSSLGWSEELSRYILIWIAWISTSYAVKKNSHIRVEIVKNLFTGVTNLIIELFVIILWFSLSLFLVVYGTKLIMTIHATNQVSPSIGLPMWFVYTAVPIGCSLMCIRLIQEVYKLFKNYGKEVTDK